LDQALKHLSLADPNNFEIDKSENKRSKHDVMQYS